MASTAADIIGIAEGITKVDSSSIGLAGLESSALLKIIDKANREYFNKELLGGGENKLLQSEAGGDLIDETALAEDITSSTTDFDVDDASDFPSSGALAIWDNGLDTVEYTSKSSNNLTGVTGIGASHEDGDVVSKLYALPTNFASFRSTDMSPEGVTVNGRPLLYVDGEPYAGRYSVYNNGTTKYLVFPQGTSGEYRVTYNRKPTDLTGGGTLDVPVDDEDFVIYRLVEYIYMILGFADKVPYARQKADKTMLDALKRRNVGKRLRLGRQVEINSDFVDVSRLFP